MTEQTAVNIEISQPDASSLVRMVTANFAKQPIISEVDKLLAKHGGKHKAESQPMRRARQRLGRTEIMTQKMAAALQEHAVKNKLQLLPSLELIDCQEVDDNFAVKFVCEVKPEIKLPDLAGAELKVPKVDVGGDFYRKQIDSLPARFPTWKQVERAAKLNDRLILVPVGRTKSEPAPQLIDEALPEDIKQVLIGSKAGDIVAPPQAQNVGKELEVRAVQEPVIPVYNQEFVKKLDPTCDSIEQFEKHYQDRHQLYIKQLVTKISARHAQELLASKAPEFSLPKCLLSYDLLQWREQLQKRYPQIEFIKHVGEEGYSKAITELSGKIRQRLLVSQFIADNALKAEQEEIDAHIEMVANDYEDPTLAKKSIAANQEQLNQIKTNILLAKVSTKIMDVVKIVEEDTSIEDLENIAQGLDAINSDQAKDGSKSAEAAANRSIAA